MATTKIIPIDQIGVWDYLAKQLFPAGIPKDESYRDELINTPVHQFIPYPDSSRNPMEHGIQDLEITWDIDFTPEQEQAWERLLKRARRMGMDDDVGDKAARQQIQVLKAWRNRTPGNETQAQIIAVLDAMVELWRLELKEE